MSTGFRLSLGASIDATDPSLEPVGEEEGLAARSLVPRPVNRRGEPGDPIACARIRFVGSFADDSEGRWQGVGR